MFYKNAGYVKKFIKSFVKYAELLKIGTRNNNKKWSILIKNSDGKGKNFSVDLVALSNYSN